MVVTFLGTGTSQGVPVIACDCQVCTSLDFRNKRLRVSVHMDIHGKSFIIDSGPDFRQQVLRERIKTLDALLFTHEHKDHTAGMDDVRSYNFRQKRDMPIYARHQVIEQLKREYSYVFADVTYPGVPRVQINEIENKPFLIEGIEVLPIEVKHYQLAIFGFRIQDFTYITDANYIAEEELKKIEGSKVVVLNALQNDPHISHFTLTQAIEVLERLRPERAYLTHISHNLGLHKDVEKKLPDFIKLAYDGLKITV
ncbi:MAG: MBL fold metallo-hydrolase [Bacteroidota bacterium]